MIYFNNRIIRFILLFLIIIFFQEPIPDDLLASKKIVLPEELEGLKLYQFNDYMEFGSKKEFWADPAVHKVI